MSSTVTSVLLAALAATAVQASPRFMGAYGGNSSLPNPTEPAPPAPPAPTPNPNAELLRELAVEQTAIGRFQKLLVDENGELLEGDALRERTVFDFEERARPNPGARGGALAASDVSTFPILAELGISNTLGFLEPCGMNTAHVHPRATEYYVVAEGKISTGMILENGLLAPGKGTGEIRTELEKFQGTVFPQGSIHYQFNSGCERAVFVASLNSENPGTNQIAQGFFNLDGDVVAATLGFPESIDGRDIEAFRSQIPANLALGVETCLRECGIDKNAPAPSK